jgi:hypothetical protein
VAHYDLTKFTDEELEQMIAVTRSKLIEIGARPDGSFSD